jgi:hypothetical protein
MYVKVRNRAFLKLWNFRGSMFQLKQQNFHLIFQIVEKMSNPRCTGVPGVCPGRGAARVPRVHQQPGAGLEKTRI